MNKQQELEMWWSLFCQMKNLPNDYRTQNHTAYINEIRFRVIDLVCELDLDDSAWNTDVIDN